MQKIHSSSNPRSLGVPPFVNQASRIRHRLPHMEASLRNGSKSTRHPPRNRRPHATTNDEPSKSSMSHLNHRLCAARHHLLALHHSRAQGLKPRLTHQLPTGINQQLVLNRHGLLPLDRSPRLARDKNPSDQCLNTQLLELQPPTRLLDHRRGVRLGLVQDYHQEETRMANLLWQLLLRPMRRVDSLSQRASSTRYPHPMLTLSHLVRWIRALVSQARSECSPSNSDHLDHMPRAATDGQTLSLRPLVV
jgi:hypothetical protein